MTKTSAWIQATRPKTLFASMGPVLLGIGITLFTGKIPTATIFALTLACAVLLQIGTNLVNDYYDAKKGIDSGDRLGPMRVTSSGMIEATQVKRAFLFCFSIAFLLGLYLMQTGGMPILIIGVLSITFAWAYTGGPFPLSYYALGELAALIFFGPVAVWGTVYLQLNQSMDEALLVGMGPGLIAAAIMAINNLRDRKSDAVAGKTTLAVLLKETQARQLVLIFIIFSSLIPVLFALHTGHFATLPVALLPLAFSKNWKQILVGPIDSELNNALAITGKYLFSYCLLFAIALAL